ncbi:MAG: hypothetical protein P4L43_19865 [Syntrophobacteraceae bacterium]|nr:hypothetical protein [Syntrophobacteraceae bacterium]
MPDEIKEKIRESLKEGTFAPQDRGSGFFLFYSFDLVNSTRLKSLNPSHWPLIFHTFHESTTDALSKRLSRIKLWKRLGDEVLLYQQIYSIKDIYNILPFSYKALQSVIHGIHTSYPAFKTTLSVKATVWFAAVDFVLPQSLQHAQKKKMNFPNLVMEDYVEDEVVSTDFLGPDIDLGFRISRYSERGRMVVGAELAYLLYRESTLPDLSWVSKDMKIVTYERLKGIWDDRYYPIIWYEDDWNVEKMFLYDEEFTSATAAKIKGEKVYEIKTLTKVFRDLDKAEQLERIYGLLKTGIAPEEQLSVKGIAPSIQAELHCVAVCFNHEGKILIAKRSREKRRLPDIWEFGCGQLKFGQTFEDCLKESYRADFNAIIEFHEKAVPISAFTLTDREENRKIPGIIFIANVTNSIDVKPVAKNHSEIVWLDPAATHSISASEAVDDFAETVKLATQRWREVPTEESSSAP